MDHFSRNARASDGLAATTWLLRKPVSSVNLPVSDEASDSNPLTGGGFWFCLAFEKTTIVSELLSIALWFMSRPSKGAVLQRWL